MAGGQIRPVDISLQFWRLLNPFFKDLEHLGHMRTFWRHLLAPKIQEGVDAQNGEFAPVPGLIGHVGAPFNRREVGTVGCGNGGPDGYSDTISINRLKANTVSVHLHRQRFWLHLRDQ